MPLVIGVTFQNFELFLSLKKASLITEFSGGHLLLEAPFWWTLSKLTIKFHIYDLISSIYPESTRSFNDLSHPQSSSFIRCRSISSRVNKTKQINLDTQIRKRKEKSSQSVINKNVEKFFSLFKRRTPPCQILSLLKLQWFLNGVQIIHEFKR